MDASSVIELSVDSFSVGLGDESILLNIDSTLPDKIRCIIADVNGRTFNMNNISTTWPLHIKENYGALQIAACDDQEECLKTATLWYFVRNER